uniref:Uncharacterized protein n=1 Tax=Nelumbo nucifera TaxID=4432 RepID=A0A822ZFG0_NELNU|nr:TPA_asm: hypothetical protein HUJ06_001847 [Nelumbo nucifera]
MGKCKRLNIVSLSSRGRDEAQPQGCESNNEGKTTQVEPNNEGQTTQGSAPVDAYSQRQPTKGTMVRRAQFAPINYIKWKDMPQTYRDDMWTTVESKFQFVPRCTEQTKKLLLQIISDKWRQWKNEIKEKGYDESKTEEEMAANVPDDRIDGNHVHWFIIGALRRER